MNISEVKLPSNRKFGFFFTIVFLSLSTYFYYEKSIVWLYTFLFLSIFFFIISIFKADMLYPLNKLWIRFGLILGVIINPIVLGVIFFGLFTPMAFVMRIFKRDELLLKVKKKQSHWIKCDNEPESKSFKNQFYYRKKMDFIKELLKFLRIRKKLWLTPIIIIMVIFGGLLILAQGSVLAPFIYTIF